MELKKKVVDVDGVKFTVPEYVERVRQGTQKAWVVRYNRVHLRFRDGAEGPAISLVAAIDGLIKCVLTMEASNRLRKKRRPGKASDLPDGISGPLERKLDGATPYAYFSVVKPIFGHKPKYEQVYIGNMYTYTLELKILALAKAISLRQQAKEEYARAATEARRAQVPELLRIRDAVLVQAKSR